MRELAGGGEGGNPLGIDLEDDAASLTSSTSRGELQRVASTLGQQVRPWLPSVTGLFINLEAWDRMCFVIQALRIIPSLDVPL